MKIEDILQFSFRASSGYPARTLLMLLAMSIGVASVIMLTALGEGARLYVTREFTSLGTHILIVLPGRSETKGGAPPLMGETPRELTLDDALALNRSAAIHRVAPITIGSAPVSWKHRNREVPILGTTPQLLEIRELSLSQGKFIPYGDPRRGEAVCVMGFKLKREIFGNRSPLGQWARIGDRRFRVIGVLAEKGHSLGVDMGDVVIMPVSSAQALFNTSSIFRIMVQAKGRDAILKAKEDTQRIIRDRHEGEDDITVITQDAVLATFDRIILALTLALAGIACISLVVAGILIMNVMMIAVSQRRSEIGLLKALGASDGQILRFFLTESGLLSLLGACCGLALAFVGIWALSLVFPTFPMKAPPWAVAAAIGTAFLTGLVFGVIPALRAGRLDPVLALSRR